MSMNVHISLIDLLHSEKYLDFLQMWEQSSGSRVITIMSGTMEFIGDINDDNVTFSKFDSLKLATVCMRIGIPFSFF